MVKKCEEVGRVIAVFDITTDTQMIWVFPARNKKTSMRRGDTVNDAKAHSNSIPPKSYV